MARLRDWPVRNLPGVFGSDRIGRSLRTVQDGHAPLLVLAARCQAHPANSTSARSIRAVPRTCRRTCSSRSAARNSRSSLESTIGQDKLRIIATSGEKRDPMLKDVPTVKESGLADYAVTSWNGLGAPVGVPAEIIALLSTEIRRALAAADVQERMLQLGLDARGSTPQEMHDQMARDIAKWRAVIEKAGIPKH
jgi:Tripartite tricarboxylate transporter family receptor